MADPRTYQFNLPATGRPSGVEIPELWYPGVQNYWSRCTSQRSVGDHIQGVEAVIIHATAGSSSAGAVSVMNSSPAASFHWLIPDENEPQHGNTFWACVRERDAAWHVRPIARHPSVNGGANRVNHWSLGIEIVNSQSGDSFSNWQVEITALLIRYCWAKYPNLKHIVSHARLDPSRRTDPGSNFPWDRFEDLVLNPTSPFAVRSSDERVENVLDSFETASAADEEANYELEEAELDKLHDAYED